MRTHTTLVNPPYPQGAHQHPPFIPLGLGYLAAVLEKNQYQVDVVDYQALKLTHEQFKAEIRKRQSDIVGVTSTTLTYKSALQIAKMAKEAHPSCLTVLGGSHVTFWDENALRECPQLDVVVRKEGEYTLLELAQRLEAGKSINDVLGTTLRSDHCSPSHVGYFHRRFYQPAALHQLSSIHKSSLRQSLSQHFETHSCEINRPHLHAYSLTFQPLLRQHLTNHFVKSWGRGVSHFGIVPPEEGTVDSLT